MKQNTVKLHPYFETNKLNSTVTLKQNIDNYTPTLKQIMNSSVTLKQNIDNYTPTLKQINRIRIHAYNIPFYYVGTFEKLFQN